MSTPDDPREVREERRVITAVFADLVGSTALGERLDPEELKVIVGDAVARVIGAVEAFGGTIKDLAGDGVLALFGAPTAHEDDPERAVRASLQIVEEIADYAREVEDAWGVTGFGVRVGVQSGPVVVGAIGAGSRVEYAALGDAVNTAARLQSAAEAGEVLVGEETFRLVEPMFDWGTATELELKGKSAPVVARVALAATGAHARTRGLEGVQARLDRRERELDAGREAVAGALAGSGGILFVTGEPGIGKTRLVAELRDLFETGTPQHGRALWLEGRCVSYGESMPYWPFRDLLRGWIGVLADEPELRVRVALAADGRAAVRSEGGRALPVPRDPPGPDARAGCRATRGRALARGPPVPDVRGRARAHRAAGRGGARGRRAGGSALVRRDIASSCSSGCSPTRRAPRSCSC